MEFLAKKIRVFTKNLELFPKNSQKTLNFPKNSEFRPKIPITSQKKSDFSPKIHPKFPQIPLTGGAARAPGGKIPQNPEVPKIKKKSEFFPPKIEVLPKNPEFLAKRKGVFLLKILIFPKNSQGILSPKNSEFSRKNSL